MAGERMSDAEAFKLAASLPPEAPHILRDHFFGDQALRAADVELPNPASDEDVVAVIDIDEYEDDLRDPEWQAWQKEAARHIQRLRAEGRDI